MFEDFDFAVLDDPSFKEDAVREELLAPLLRALGYRPSGDIRVERGKSLSNPFVRVGTRNHPVTLVPDYVLWKGDRALLVLDAKRPGEDVRSPKHVQQAYSYAIHPEIRCPRFALCNGHELVMFDVSDFESVFSFAPRDVAKDLVRVYHYLGPDFLANPKLRDFVPDFGLHLVRLGIGEGQTIPLPQCRPQLMSLLAPGKYSMSGRVRIGADEGRYMASLDFDESALHALLAELPARAAACIRTGLTRSPFHVALELLLGVDVVAELGPMTKGEHDWFVPLVVREMRGPVLYDAPASRPTTDDLPHYVIRLGDALKEDGDEK